ncbi:hypothetical protein TH61_13885 [Rufibacter sp. DG15C]|nr:hypothetical protein TH61_13885 [Rufibacter sp. DG15C]
MRLFLSAALAFLSITAQAQDGTNALVYPLQKSQAAVPIEARRYYAIKLKDRLIAIEKENADKLNPAWIENVDVLKGKSALEAYGDKAKGGAIIITIKKESEADVQMYLNSKKD